MSQYKDISSYQLAVKLRTPKTILVEGVTDKAVLSRYLVGSNFSEKVQSQFLIDEVAIIGNDPALSGLGNRERLLATADVLKQGCEKIKFLADREWDDVDVNAVDESSFSQVCDVVLRTKGHSIENYWFEERALVHFLLHVHAANVNVDFLEGVRSRFRDFLILSASYSLAAKESGCITRCGGMIAAEDIEWTGGEYKARESLQAKAIQRGITDDLPHIMEGLRPKVEIIAPDLLRWICHGHLGEEAIRACAANLAIEKGVPAVTATAIERGHQREKLLHDASYISGLDAESLEPLGEILRWVRQ